MSSLRVRGAPGSLDDECGDDRFDSFRLMRQEVLYEVVCSNRTQGLSHGLDLAAKSPVVGDDQVGAIGDGSGHNVTVLGVHSNESGRFDVADLVSVAAERVGGLRDSTSESGWVEVWEGGEEVPFDHQLGHKGSVVETEVFGVARHLIQDRPPVGDHVVAVGEQFGKGDTPV